MATEYANEHAQSRYTMRVDGELVAVLDYAANQSEISLVRAFTPPNQRGKGYAGDLVAWVVDDIETNDTRKIVPMCSYVGAWFEHHPERAALLTRS